MLPSYSGGSSEINNFEIFSVRGGGGGSETCFAISAFRIWNLFSYKGGGASAGCAPLFYRSATASYPGMGALVMNYVQLYAQLFGKKSGCVYHYGYTHCTTYHKVAGLVIILSRK